MKDNEVLIMLKCLLTGAIISPVVMLVVFLVFTLF